jgi:D-alanyl-D-alanine carboxypeptidase/D-alanyl-D-alanine-endopeptidase (penicillin-binding protein 4)
MRWRLAVYLLALDVAGCAKAQPALPLIPHFDPLQQLHSTILAATKSPGVQRAAWGIAVHSLDRNERLFELNAGTLLVPASVGKLVAVATAVEAVGWTYRYETTLRGTGPVVGGVLQGDLVIVGSGDPTIGGRGGEDLTAWVDALKARGIRRIDGRVIGDDDAIEEPRPQLAWAWDDLGYTAGALFGALNLGENRMAVTVTPSHTEGGPTTLTVDPAAADRPLGNRSVTGRAGTQQLLWPEQRPGEPFLTVAGSIPAGAQPARLNVSAGNPTFWFASVFRHRLQRAGIEVTGEAWDVDDAVPKPVKDSGDVLYTHRSGPLAEIAQPLLKESINLYGEAVMRLNAPPGAYPTNDAAIEGMRLRMDEWGIPRDAWQVIDGSGLSRRNAIAADAIVTVLQRMFDGSGMSPWMRALPIAGVDGTLETRMRGTPAESTVRAKTGTMSNIRALAGYARTRDGEQLAFAIMADHFEGPGGAATEAIDHIAVALASFSRN